MVRTFVGNLILLIVANLLVKPFWVFGIDLQVQNQVGTETYGMYAALFSFTLLPTMLLDMGINQYNNTSIAREPQKANSLMAMLLPAKLVLCIVYFSAIVLLGLLMGDAIYRSELMLLLALNQLLAGLVVYLRSTLSGLHHFRTDTLLSILDKLLMVAFCGTLLYSGTFPPMQIEWFVYAQTLAYLITLALTWFLVKRKVGGLSFKMDLGNLKKSLRSSFPFALLMLLMLLYTRTDIVLLERLLPDGKLQSGRYVQAYRLFDAFNMVAVLVASLLLPMFARLLQNKLRVGKLVGTASILLILPAACLAIFCGFYGWDIMYLLYRQQVSPDAVTVFRLLMLAFVAMCSNYVFSTLLTANGNIRLLCLISLVALVINVGLNTWLIPDGKTIATAFSALLTFGFVAIACIAFCLVKGLIQINWRMLLKSMLLLGILFILLQMLVDAKMHMVNALIIIGTASLFLAFILRLISIREIKYFFNKPD